MICGRCEQPQCMSPVHTRKLKTILATRQHQLTSFEIKPGYNFFPATSEEGTIILLEPSDTLCFTGTVRLKVLHGSVEVLGTELPPSSRCHPIFAPRSAPLPVLRCSSTVHAADDSHINAEIPQEIAEKLTSSNCAVLLQTLKTGVEGMGKVCCVFDGVFQGVNSVGDSTRTEWAIDGFYPVGDSPFGSEQNGRLRSFT